MEFGAKQVKEAQFREKIRGYNPDDVDNFLEQVAMGIGRLEERVRDLEGELRLAKSKLQNNSVGDELGSPNSSTPDFASTTELYEIFSLAKRSADEITRNAKHDANQMLLDVQSEAQSMRESAQLEISQFRQDELQLINEEIAAQKEARDEIRRELIRLGGIASSARSSVRTSLAEALAAVDTAFSDLYTPDDGYSVVDAESHFDDVSDLAIESLDSPSNVHAIRKPMG